MWRALKVQKQAKSTNTEDPYMPPLNYDPHADQDVDVMALSGPPVSCFIPAPAAAGIFIWTVLLLQLFLALYADVQWPLFISFWVSCYLVLLQVSCSIMIFHLSAFCPNCHVCRSCLLWSQLFLFLTWPLLLLQFSCSIVPPWRC